MDAADKGAHAGVAVVGLLVLGAGVSVLVTALLAATARGAFFCVDACILIYVYTHTLNHLYIVTHTHTYQYPSHPNHAPKTTTVWGPVRSGEFQMVTLDFLALCAYFIAPLLFVYYLAAQQARDTLPASLPAVVRVINTHTHKYRYI